MAHSNSNKSYTLKFRHLFWSLVVILFWAIFVVACSSPVTTVTTSSSGSLPAVAASPTPTTSGQSEPTPRPPTPSPVPTSAEITEPSAVSSPEVVVEMPTAEPTLEPTPSPKLIFDAFVERVKNDKPDQIVGVYVEGVLALRVVQPPTNASGQPINPVYVAVKDKVVTQFLYAYIYANGNIGLLAHNFLAGRFFFNLKEGDLVVIVYGDGHLEDYTISEIKQYQALSPRSPTSDFLDLATGETVSSTNLFYRVYGGDKRVTFQTCINRDNDSEWGRLFPIAFPGN